MAGATTGVLPTPTRRGGHLGPISMVTTKSSKLFGERSLKFKDYNMDEDDDDWSIKAKGCKRSADDESNGSESALKRARNREAARKTRARRAQQLQDLQEKLSDLQEENKLLQDRVETATAKYEQSIEEQQSLKRALKALKERQGKLKRILPPPTGAAAHNLPAPGTGPVSASFPQAEPLSDAPTSLTEHMPTTTPRKPSQVAVFGHPLDPGLALCLPESPAPWSPTLHLGKAIEAACDEDAFGEAASLLECADMLGLVDLDCCTGDDDLAELVF